MKENRYVKSQTLLGGNLLSVITESLRMRIDEGQ